MNRTGGSVSDAAYVVVGRLAVGLTAGLALAAGYWVTYLACEGQSVVAAARGEVEDALGTLQALGTLGGLCGAGVGLLAGLRAAASMSRNPAEPASSNVTSEEGSWSDQSRPSGPI
jgi:hypothetical protein